MNVIVNKVHKRNLCSNSKTVKQDTLKRRRIALCPKTSKRMIMDEQRNSSCDLWFREYLDECGYIFIYWLKGNTPTNNYCLFL